MSAWHFFYYDYYYMSLCPWPLLLFKKWVGRALTPSHRGLISRSPTYSIEIPSLVLRRRRTDPSPTPATHFPWQNGDLLWLFPNKRLHKLPPFYLWPSLISLICAKVMTLVSRHFFVKSVSGDRSLIHAGACYPSCRLHGGIGTGSVPLDISLPK